MGSGAKGGSGKYEPSDGDLKFPKQSSDDYYEIEFCLNDSSGLSLFFPAKKADALWAHEGKCPPPEGIKTKDIKVKKVSAGGKSLTIENYNSDQADLAFMLRFQSRTNPQWYEFDPIIQNGGGGTPPFIDPRNPLPYLVAAGLFGLFFVVERFLRKTRSGPTRIELN